MTDDRLRAALAAGGERVRADLERLIRVPSVAFPGFDHTQVERSADLVAELLRAEGFPEVKIVRGGGQPAVLAIRPAPPGAPTVMLYAHHDVQPAGDLATWEGDPFEPEERGGRLYARGAADDKAGIMVHLAALRALGGAPELGIVVLIEGEEETGSETLGTILREHCDQLPLDVIVIADSGNWRVGQPALTTSLRGLVNAFVEVSTLEHSVHSGFFGGPVPDALTTLCRLLASLHDETGRVAVEGLVATAAAELDYPEDRLRADAALLDGVRLVGSGRVVERMWTQPAISVLGIDAPPAGEAANALVPSARAKISLRVAPGDDARHAFQMLSEHLERRVPWGARLVITLESLGDPCAIDTSGPVFELMRGSLAEAWDGVRPVEMGMGGSIPFVATFQRIFPGTAVVITGVEDPDARAHGPNESLHLQEFERACLAEAGFLAGLGRPGR